MRGDTYTALMRMMNTPNRAAQRRPCRMRATARCHSPCYKHRYLLSTRTHQRGWRENDRTDARALAVRCAHQKRWGGYARFQRAEHRKTRTGTHAYHCACSCAAFQIHRVFRRCIIGTKLWRQAGGQGRVDQDQDDHAPEKLMRCGCRPCNRPTETRLYPRSKSRDTMASGMGQSNEVDSGRLQGHHVICKRRP